MQTQQQLFLKSVMNAQMSPEKMARYQEIHDMIAEVPEIRK